MSTYRNNHSINLQCLNKLHCLLRHFVYLRRLVNCHTAYNGSFKRMDVIVVLIALFSQCAHPVYDLPATSCSGDESGRYSQSDAVKTVMNKLVETVPGAAIAVWSSDGLWEFSAGYAKLETKTPMKSCHLQYLQSVSKTYAA